jgi:hypothetical protein
MSKLPETPMRTSVRINGRLDVYTIVEFSCA